MKEVFDLKLVYINGQDHVRPAFKDIRLDRDSQTKCEKVIAEAENFDRRIRSKSELAACIAALKHAEGLLAALKELTVEERKDWKKVLAQIDASTTATIARLDKIKFKLRARIAGWEEEVEKGRQKQFEDLKRQAEEMALKSRIDSNPQVRREAKVKSEELEAEAAQFTPPKRKGYHNVEDYELEIENRVLAAKLPDEAVEMTIHPNWFKSRIREAKANNQSMPIFPGIKVTTVTRQEFQ